MYTDHAAVIELFKSKNLMGKLAPCYLTIQEFSPKFKCIHGCSNVVGDALSRNALVGAMNDTSPGTNFTLQNLGTALTKHDTWAKVTYALGSGDETTLPRLPISFSQFL